MTTSRHFDTVAFDVRENAAMLFFAKTRPNGDIDSYILLMRGVNDEFEETLCLEIDERQISGDRVIEQAELDDNLLRLSLNRDAEQTFGDREIVVTFDDNERNRAGIESGSLRVLGDILLAGHG